MSRRERTPWAQGVPAGWEGKGVCGPRSPHPPRVVTGLSRRRRAGKPPRRTPAHCTCWRPADAPSFPEGKTERCTQEHEQGTAAPSPDRKLAAAPPSQLPTARRSEPMPGTELTYVPRELRNHTPGHPCSIQGLRMCRRAMCHSWHKTCHLWSEQSATQLHILTFFLNKSHHVNI